MKYILCIFALISGSILANVIPDEPHVYVEGYAEMPVYPDQIKFTLQISDINVDTTTAKANVDKKTLALFNAAKKVGLNDKDISSTPLQISPATEYRDGKRIVIGVNVSRNVDLVLRNINNYSELNNAIVDADITKTVNSYAVISNEQDVKQKVLLKAMNNAKHKAEQLAFIQQKQIKDVHSISEFNSRQEDIYQLRPSQEIFGMSYQNSIELFRRDSKGASPEVFKVGEMTASAKVYVVYTIE